MYRGGEPVQPDEELIPPDGVGTVVESDGRIVGAATALRFEVSLFEEFVPCAGVAGVGVVPEFRRSGAGSELMLGSNRWYREQGFLLAALYPFRAGFYRRFGYEYAGLRQKVSVSPDLLPPIADPLPIRELARDQSGDLESAFEAFARNYNGMNRRSKVQWDRALGTGRPFTIYAAGDPVEAYALAHLDGAFWVNQPVREVVWATRRGYESLLTLFAGLAMNKSSIEWFEPSDGPFRLSHLDQKAELKADGQVMWRVLDVPATLCRLRSETRAEFTFEVEDPTIPENRGPWRVAFGPDGACVEPAAQGDLRIGIGDLTQAVLGEPGFESLVRAGRIQGGEGAIRAAAALFRSRPVYLLEWF